MVKNKKRFCLFHSISQESCIIWFWFTVLMCKIKYLQEFVNSCKMIISSAIFFYFCKILIFWIVRSVKWQKMAHNDKKHCPLHFISQELKKNYNHMRYTLCLRNCTSYDYGFWYTCVKSWYFHQFFFIFSKFRFFVFSKVHQ